MKNRLVVCVAFLLMGSFAVAAESDSHAVLLRDITTVEGVRENPLIGYGIVVGLNGTGDRRQTMFTIQTLANTLQRMGVQIPAGTARVNNVAAVFVTGALPPFARPGTQVDVTVSSIGDAKSLEGGTLLLTPLYAADGQVYAAAQGALTLGGYSSGPAGNAKQVNHPTVGRIPSGAVVERDASIDLHRLGKLSLLLRDTNFRAAAEIADSINRELGRRVAEAVDGRRIQIDPAVAAEPSLPRLLGRLEELVVHITPRAKVVVNERTGTIVMGKDVRLSAVSILHGSLTVEIATQFAVSQPEALSKGETAVVPQQEVRTDEKPARRVELSQGATIEQLVSGLQSIGATARDVIAILQAIQRAGALEAELEVI